MIPLPTTPTMDTYERLQKKDLKLSATIVASMAYRTAMRNTKLPRKPLSKPRPTS